MKKQPYSHLKKKYTMKKLLILILVFLIASSAAAWNLELSVNGSRDGTGNTTEITIDVDASMTIGVYSNYTVADEFWLGIVADTGDGEWGGTYIRFIRQWEMQQRLLLPMILTGCISEPIFMTLRIHQDRVSGLR